MSDVLVVGGGGMGLAAAAHLAGRGRQVRVFERFGIAHDRGSSHGHTRIIRLAYFEHPSYVPLLRRSFELWRALERRTGATLLQVTGGLDVGPPGSEVFEGARRSCREHDLPHEVLDGRALRQRFPAWRADDGLAAVFQPDAGFLRPEACLRAHAAEARAAGAIIHEDEPAIDWESRGQGVRVRTARGTYEAAQLVLSAGAWMAGLLPDRAPLMRPERQVVGWFDVAPGSARAFLPDQFPVFVQDAPEGRFYGFPIVDGAGFKIGRYHHLGEQVDPDTMDRACGAADEAALRSAVSRYFPMANGRLRDAGACLFTNTPDGHFIVDRLPASEAVLVVSPCSGHGFKFCTVIGEIVADLVTTGRTAHDISAFSLTRFDGAPSGPV